MESSYENESDMIETINSLEKIYLIEGRKEIDVTDKYMRKYVKFI